MRKSQNEEVCEGLRAQIRELWDRLQIPAEEREAVATVMSGSKAKVRKAVRNPMGARSAVSTNVKSVVLTSFLPQASLFLKTSIRGVRVAQLIKRPASAQVTISQFVGSSPSSGSVRTAQSLEPVLDSVSPSLFAPPPFARARSLSKINKHLIQF